VPGSGPGACAATDQLAFVRPIGVRCDMGATEQRGGFSVAKISPRRGGNQGSVSAGIVGTGFRAGATVSLRRAGEPDIPGQPVFVDAGGSAISVAFDLNGRPPGPWDVAVTIPGGSVVTLADAFTIEAGGTADLWVDVVGALRRPGRRSTFTVVYGNRGSVDALGVPLSLSIPQGYQAALHVPIEPPPAQTGEARPPWHGVSPLVAQPAQDSFLQLPLFLPIVPSGSTMTFSVALTAPVNADDTFMMAAIGRPSLTPGAPATQFVSDAIAGARSYLQQAAGIVVPTALAAQMQAYAATQFDTVVASGRTAIAASLGTRTPIYSLAQLQLDLAFFAAARAAQPTASPGSR
jgi:hypothetical protein